MELLVIPSYPNPGDFDAVEGVLRKQADGFHDDHVCLAAPVLADQLVELITLFHADTGDALIGINAYKLPDGFHPLFYCGNRVSVLPRHKLPY